MIVSLACLSAALVLGGKPDQAPPINPRFNTKMPPTNCNCVDCPCVDCDGKCSLGRPVVMNPAGVNPVRSYTKRVQQTGSEMVRVCEGGRCRYEMRPTFREVWIAR